MPGPKSDKIWADAVRKAVHEYSDADDPEAKGKKIKYVNLLARNLVKSAAGGDMQAMKEVGDRLDGKPKQAVEHSGEVEQRYVARIPEPANSTDEWRKQHSPTTH